MTELPEITFYVVGFLILTNIASIITVIGAVIKGIWWASKMDTTLAHLEKEILQAKQQNKEQLDYAHSNIRKNRDAIAKLDADLRG